MQLALVARNIAGAVRLMVAPLRAGMLWIFAFITISGLTWAGAFTLIDDTLMDWRFRLLERAPTQSVVIVEIDPQSISEYQSWPWSRSVYADVIKELQDAGAGTIALDVDFSSLSDEEGDEYLS